MRKNLYFVVKHAQLQKVRDWYDFNFKRKIKKLVNSRGSLSFPSLNTRHVFSVSFLLIKSFWLHHQRRLCCLRASDLIIRGDFVALFGSTFYDLKLHKCHREQIQFFTRRHERALRSVVAHLCASWKEELAIFPVKDAEQISAKNTICE